MDRSQELPASLQHCHRRVDSRRLFCIDETGLTIAVALDRGWAPRGDEVDDVIPRNRGAVTTMIGALTLDGLTAMMTVEGGTDDDGSAGYLRNVFVRQLQEGHIVALDNLGAHTTRQARELVEAAGARLWFTPPYSPEYHPHRADLAQCQTLPQDCRGPSC